VQIGVELFGRTAALAEGMNIITDFFAMMTIFLAAFFVMLGFFVLALQLFVVLIAFKLGSLVAFVALPWGVFNGTAWVAERPLGWVGLGHASLRFGLRRFRLDHLRQHAARDHHARRRRRAQCAACSAHRAGAFLVRADSRERGRTTQLRGHGSASKEVVMEKQRQ
jgi:hypothetical protein